MREPTTRPNVILINCDDLGWGDLACTGHPNHKTPYLDKMAREGTRFTDFYQGSPICTPSRGAMLTGCYPPRIGFDSFDGAGVLFPGQAMGLDPKEETLPSMFKRQGYQTCMVGKWHCGDQPAFLPTRHGFDEYFGLPYSNDMGRQEGGKSDRPPLPLLINEEVIEAQPDQAALTSRYVEHSLRFIREHKDKPFFLYFAHMYVHLPLYVPKCFEMESNNGSYGAAVSCIDWSVGMILREISLQGLDANTMVIFTSDNGSRCDFGSSNGILRGAKNSCWEGGMRVPFLVRWPGQVPEGHVKNGIITGMDLLPTLANLAGTSLKSRNPIDGLDIGTFIKEKDSLSPRDHYLYYRQSGLYGIRQGKWKRVVASHGYVDKAGLKTGLDELYDLEKDPGEKRNVANEHPDIVRSLEGVLAKVRLDLGDDLASEKGQGNRTHGRVESPEPLTHYDPEHPYYIAMYDLKDIG
jgi:arylsulfatase A-like enzyme